MSEEKLVFPSEEWIAKYMEALNSSSAYEEAAKTWEGDFIFQIDADGEIIKEPIRFYLDLWHGKCKAARMAGPDDTAEFVYAGAYSSWKALFAGKVHPIKGIMQRKFALTGNYGKVMRATKAAMELVATAASIPTKFLDE
ncbi:MAG: SCP2 sterol-binding domain-containing protein [Candidatus Thorarchaeota archaeon]|nr:SCP2 sterol-binding domain-containing protein [Candidatus Thorarchaeota archaeon]